MADKDSRNPETRAADAREARLKAALRANLQKRKAQARKRQADTPKPGDATKKEG